jgi:hypothetical protein
MWTYLTAYTYWKHEGDIVSDLVQSCNRSCPVYIPWYSLLMYRFDPASGLDMFDCFYTLMWEVAFWPKTMTNIEPPHIGISTMKTSYSCGVDIFKLYNKRDDTTCLVVNFPVVHSDITYNSRIIEQNNIFVCWQNGLRLNVLKVLITLK